MNASTRWLFIFLLALTGCTTLRRPEIATGPAFRLLTYNINCGTAPSQSTVDAILNANPDIVCLQETSAPLEKYLREQLGHEYPFMAFRETETRRAGGFAFLSKVPATEVAYIEPETDWFGGWIMAFDTAAGKVQVLNVHLHPPASEEGTIGISGYLGTDDDREKEIKRFYQHLDQSMPLLIAGDFNDDENSRPVRWLENQHMLNALPQFDADTPTWRWKTRSLTLDRRLDHILYSSNLYCFAANVILEGTSDHYPVTAEFGTRSGREGE